MARRIELSAELDTWASLTFRLLSALEHLPELGRGLGRVVVLRRGRGWALSRWEARLAGEPLSWLQEDRFDRHGRRVHFRLAEPSIGGPVVLEGEWLVEELTTCTCSVNLRLAVDFGRHPRRRILERATEGLFAALLEGVRRRLEAPMPLGRLEGRPRALTAPASGPTIGHHDRGAGERAGGDQGRP